VRRAAICFVFLAFSAQGGVAQSVPPLSGSQPSTATGVPQAPVGHRQPTPADLPPAVQKEEEPGAKPWPTPQSQAQSPPQTQRKSQTQTKPETQTKSEPQSRSRQQSARVRGGNGGGPPVLQVGPSCEAAGRGAVVLGRNKEACLADENAALTTLKQNWAKYAAGDKTLCIGMETTGGPASYVELLSCLEVNRDAHAIQSADPLEADLTRPASTTTGAASMGSGSGDSPRHRRRH
jgi:hypothetical protein